MFPALGGLCDDWLASVPTIVRRAAIARTVSRTKIGGVLSTNTDRSPLIDFGASGEAARNLTPAAPCRPAAFWAPSIFSRTPSSISVTLPRSLRWVEVPARSQQTVCAEPQRILRRTGKPPKVESLQTDLQTNSLRPPVSGRHGKGLASLKSPIKRANLGLNEIRRDGSARI